MDMSNDLRFEELESLEAPSYSDWYAGVKIGVVIGLIGLAIT